MRTQSTLQALFVARSRIVATVTWIITLLCLVTLAGCRSPQPLTLTATPPPTSTQSLIALATLGTATPVVTATFPPCGTASAGWAPYTVEAGDTLAALAARAGVSLDSLLRANCREAGDLLRTGSTIFLPVRPTATPCAAPPADWIPYIVEAGDTLAALAAHAGVSLDSVLRANCRKADDLLRTGSTIFLPRRPTATPCAAPPAGWQLYLVRAGETLAGLADRAGIRPETIIQANCLTSANLLPGQQLWVPPLREPTATPSPCARRAAGSATSCDPVIPCSLSPCSATPRWLKSCVSTASPRRASSPGSH